MAPTIPPCRDLNHACEVVTITPLFSYTPVQAVRVVPVDSWLGSPQGALIAAMSYILTI